jgi:type IVB pilus formation R64 PilN family outer membrane protein
MFSMHTPTPKTLIGSALVSALALSACSNDMSEQSGRKGASAQIGAMEAQIDEDSGQLQRMTETGRPGNIRVRDGIYLGEDGFRTGRGDPLPRRFETDDGISMNLSGEVNVREFSIALRRLTGLRVDYRDIANTPGMGSDDGGQAAPAPTGNTDSSQNVSLDDIIAGNAAAPATATPAPQSSGANADHPINIGFPVDYTGPLSGLLDKVATHIGVDWEYRGGRIKFVGAQTVTYTLWALPGTSETDSSVGGGGSGNVFGASSPATTSRSIERDFWSDLETGLDAIIPSSGARYAMNRANGTIVVTGFQNVHERVSDYVERENARLSRQVAVKMDILAYSSNESDTRATSFDLAISDIAAGLNIGIQTPPNQIEGSSGLGFSVLDSGSDFNGSSAFIRALSRQGKVTVLNSASVIASNNASTPLSILSEQAYLSGTTTDTNPDTGEETTELETGVISNGINMVVTPRILNSGAVNLDYTLNISQLTNLEEFESNGSTVQLPEIETRNFMQNLNMDSGDTMVIASYDSSRTQRDGSGPFDPRLWGIGGQDGYQIENTKIIVLMTPVVVEKQNAPRARR